MTDLQRLCMYALEDITLIELNDKYFDGLGIEWTKNHIAGDRIMLPVIAKAYEGRFEKKYHDKVADYKRIKEQTKGGW